MRREREEGEEERKVREGEGWREGEGMDLLDQCQTVTATRGSLKLRN